MRRRPNLLHSPLTSAVFSTLHYPLPHPCCLPGYPVVTSMARGVYNPFHQTVRVRTFVVTITPPIDVQPHGAW